MSQVQDWVRQCAPWITAPDLVTALQELSDATTEYAIRKLIAGGCESEKVDGKWRIYVTNKTVGHLAEAFGENVREFFKQDLAHFNAERAHTRKPLATLGQAKGSEVLQNLQGAAPQQPRPKKNRRNRHKKVMANSNTMKGKNAMTNQAQSQQPVAQAPQQQAPVAQAFDYSAVARQIAREEASQAMTAAVKESVAASKKYIDEVVGNVVSTQKQQMDELLKLAPPELKKAMASGDSDLFMAALGQAVIGASPKEMAAWKAKVAESVNSKEVEALIASAAKKAMDELEEKGQDAEGALAKQLARRAKQSTFHTVVKWTAIALGTVAGIAVLFEIGCALTGRNGFLVKRNFSNEELLNMMEQNNSKQNRIDA